MAKLFGKEYHEHSNSYYFQSTIVKYDKDDLIVRTNKDEKGNKILVFSPKSKRASAKPWKIIIVYDENKRRIQKHTCTLCGEEQCEHFLSIINYGYKYLTSDIFKQATIQTYQTHILAYNEFWQQVVLNARIFVEDIYTLSDKIRFYFDEYRPIDIKLVSLIVSNREIKEEDLPLVSQARKQSEAFTYEEIRLLQRLKKYKCAYSDSNTFFTIYKKDFVHFLPVIKNLKNKIFIKETGEPLLFSETPMTINFNVLKVNDAYKLQAVNFDKISAVFTGHTTYVFKKNIIHPIHLPFLPEVTNAILTEGFRLSEPDLVYVACVVSRQLSFIKCYLDFEDDITLPKFWSKNPKVSFNLYKENDKIHLNGSLIYDDEVVIPMSVIRHNSELVRFDQAGEETWFYISPQIRYQIINFTEKLPYSDTISTDNDFELIFSGADEIAELKKIIYENTPSDWMINLSEDLKNEFIYRVDLVPEIIAKTSNDISWFDYKITYKYNDITFNHQDLEKFFATKEKFMQLDDGRLVYFSNKTAFDEINTFIKKSKISEENNHYKGALYNVPFLYQLPNVVKGTKILGDQYLENMFEHILAREMPKTMIPQELSAIMRSYQKAGFRWMKMLANYNLNGILADDMGLGKTIQSIAILTDLSLDKVSLVVAPKTLLFNWAAEIEKFSPNLKYVIYEGSKRNRDYILNNFEYNIVIASYAIVQNDILDLKNKTFEYVILDEAQHIKNPNALRTKAVKALQAKHKLALTGTPMENSPVELWSIFDFLMPGYLPKLKKFRSDVLSGKSEKIKSLIAPFIMRRKKSNVLIELPDKQEQIVYCKMSKQQEQMYVSILNIVKKELFDSKNNEIPYLHVLVALMKLRQLCNHPYLIDDSLDEDISLSGKIEAFIEIVRDAVENGRKILIFSQFVGMLRLLRNILDDEEIMYEYMDGSTKNRERHINNFNENPSIRIFLISLKTGGYGLNLTSADTVILTDPWWNPMGENQAIDRVHRIGQNRKVMVYKLITKGSVEEKILNLQKNKIQMFENIIEDGQNILKSLDVDEIRELFEYEN